MTTLRARRSTCSGITDRRILGDEPWQDLAAKAFDPPRHFAAFLHTLRWNCVTATETHPGLEAAGKTYHEFRAALMVRNNFHDPEERSAEIFQLRELHAAMDRTALDAYGWKEIPTACEFRLDYEIDVEEWGSKKKPWRYRWPDEVLARLLELNAQRAREEAHSGPASKKRCDKSGKKKPAPQGEGLFS